MSIAMKCVGVYEQCGELFYKKNSEYEIQNYYLNGLRKDYKFNLLNQGENE